MAVKKRKSYIWLGVAVGLFAFGATIAGTVYEDSDEGASGPSKEEVLEYATLASLTSGRADLGFDTASVNSLLDDSTARSGMLETGFLLSTDERAKLDARVALGESMMAALGRSDGNDGFGGARMEHTGNGVFHVYHTSDSDGTAVKADFQAAAPSGATVQFHVVANSKKDLIAVRNQLWSDLADSDLGHGGLHAIGIDIENNQLVIELDSNISVEDRNSSQSLASRLGSQITGVSYRITYTELGTDSACDDFPEDCADPMMGGIRITKGSNDGGACTLGFMVKDGSDTQILTAGHCGYTGSSNWYHEGYGSSSFGSEIDDSAYTDEGRDGMLIQLPDSQGSNDVAYCAGQYCLQITGHLNSSDLYEEMPLNTLGQASGHRTGIIMDIDYSWWSGKCNCPQYGISATYSSADGDSGGPVWYGSKAVALHSSGGSSALRRAVQIQTLLDIYDVVMRTS